MGAEQTWPDDVALEALGDAARELTLLDVAPPAAGLKEAVDRAVKTLCRAIEKCEEAGIDKREILSRLGEARAMHASSPFFKRAQEWPRGYPGDFETIEYLCNGVNYATPGTVGHALEGLVLEGPIADQYRNRVTFQADAILTACTRKNAGARILSIGCGGCRDIRSVTDRLRNDSAEFVLCDLDYEALDVSLHALGPLASRCTYLNAGIPRVFRKLVPFGPFDLAIANGMFDYLPDSWVTIGVQHVWRKLLAPEGQLIFTNSKRGNSYRVWLEYLANWDLNERAESDILRCCVDAGVPDSAVDVRDDGSGLALLVTCQRPD